MKALATILAVSMFAFFASAEEVTFQLTGIEQGQKDYSEQLIAKFRESIKVNEELKEKFDSYSEVARKRSGGKYMGPEIQPLMLRRSEEVYFRDSGG